MPIRNLLPADLPDLPDLSANPEEILNRMILRYEEAYLEQTGAQVTLATGDPIRIWLYTIALQQYLLENLVKYYASQNFLAYAKGTFLDNISATRGGPLRSDATAAVVTIRFTFSIALVQTEIIPAGTRVTPDSSLFFSVDEPYSLPVGTATWEGIFTCNTPGVIGNGFVPGQIATLVDPLPYVQDIINIDTSQGGSDIMDDEQFAELVYLSPEGFSVAGPELAYEYLAKSFSPAVMDAKAYRAAPGEVNVVIVLQDGIVPESAFLAELLEFLSAKDKRPLTDYVHAIAPTVTTFDIKFTYFIESSKSNQLQAIRDAIDQAVKDYISWQKDRLGRDINPQELISRVREAGARRLVIESPEYTIISPYGIAIAGEVTADYGGLEDE